MHARNGSRAPGATGQRVAMGKRLAAMEERLSGQQEEIERLRARPAAPLILPADLRQPGGGAEGGRVSRQPGGRPSRRGLLKLGGAAAAAGVAAVAATATSRPPVARAFGMTWQTGLLNADDQTFVEPQNDMFPDPTLLSVRVGTGAINTQLTAPNSAALAAYDSTAGSAYAIFATSQSGTAVFALGGNNRSALVGFAPGGSGYGVFGESDAGYGVLGVTTTGIDVAAFGTGRIFQIEQGTVGPPTTGLKGEQIRDSNGDLWICVVSSSLILNTAAEWRKVAAPQLNFAGGALNLLPVAIRLLDTRGGAPVAYHATAQFQAAGVGAIPAGAVAVFGHLAAGPRIGVSCGDGSSARIWPAGQPMPAAVHVVYNDPVNSLGQCLTGTLALVAIGASGKISLYSQPINQVGVDYLFDAFGFVM